MEVDSLHISLSANTGNAAQNISQTANELNKLGDSAKTADTDMAALVRAMSEAASNMTAVSSSIGSSAGFAGFQTNLDAVSSALQSVNLRFDSLSGSIQQSYSAFDGAAESVSTLSAASESSAAALSGIVSATDGFSDRMSDLKGNTDGTAAGMSELQRELSETLSVLNGFSKNLNTAGVDAATTSKQIKELSEQVKNMPTSQPAMLAASFRSLKGIVATLGIGKFIKDSNDAYVEQMQNELKLTNHMKRRMGATDDQVAAIKRLASEQQKIGVIGDEIQLAGAQQLTTYARQASTLQTLLPAMNNLIAQNAGYEASVGDATSAADMLGRALNGQYTSLKRMGISFTAAQEQVLKYGTESQRAAVLAEAINEKVGNMNELLAQTPTGKLKQLQNDFGDLQEQIGATFQPLITAIVPVLGGLMNSLAEPIKAVSTGITIIGQAIASIDSPAVRAIGLAAAGIAVMHKLKAAIGGTSAGLLLLGVLLSGLVGSMADTQESVGNIVNTAYDNATVATNNATDAAKNYDEQLQEVKKTASKLAGFDTITKLSGGGSSGSLVASLFSEGDLQDLYDLADAAYDVQAAVDGLDLNLPTANWDQVKDKAERFFSKLDYVFKHWGNDDAMYRPLKDMTSEIEKILNAAGLDGTGITNFFKGVGGDIYNAFNGNEVEGLRGLTKKVEDLLNGIGLNGSGLVNVFVKAGAQIYDAFGGLFSAFDDLSKGNYEAAANKVTASIEAQGNLLQTLGFMSNNPAIGGILDWSGKNMTAGADTAKKIYEEGLAGLGLYTPENTEGVINRFMKAEGAPLEAYYKWGSSGMPYTVPKTAVNSMGTSYTDIPLQPTGLSSMPAEARQYINVYINGEKYDYERLEMTGGLAQ